VLQGEVSRLAIGRLETTGVAMVCVAYAELDGNPPHMRYLLRRIRQRFPSRPILVGFWNPSDPILTDAAAQGMAGVRLVASSFHDAVTKCLEEARRAEEPEKRQDDGTGGENRSAPRPIGDSATVTVAAAADG
jgi:hypothetical protein